MLVLIGSLSFAQTSDETLNQFLRSDKYTTLKKTFQLVDNDFDLRTYDKQILEDGKVEFFKIQVNSNSKINFATFYKSGDEFTVVYEKNNLDEKANSGYFEHYSESGDFYADFIVKKVKENLYSFRINDVSSSKRLGIYTTTVSTQKAAPCLTTTYNFIKKTCEADLTCDFMCDLVPSCHPQMMIVAAAHCMLH